jgi:putative membrane protein
VNRLATIVFGLVIGVHLAFFAGEALLWSSPVVQHFVLPQLNPGLSVPERVQAEVLRALFFNQGFYNLFVSFGGLVGIVLIARGRVPAGVTLVRFVSAFAFGAGLVLMASTSAIAGGAVQASLGASALLLSLRRQVVT